MKILFLGDIVGSPGRNVIKRLLDDYRRMEDIDVVIANGENAAGGSGLTPKITDELLAAGIDVITTGDHVWKKKDIYPYLATTNKLVRPANYPEGAPGEGSTVFETKRGAKIAVINLIGRVFMDALDCPFVAVKKELLKVKKETNIILVDLHAEATSEKIAMGWYLDGKVSAVVGTHTHVQTADEKILPKGTAYITDTGMTGPFTSVIGREVEPVLERFITQRPTRFNVATEGLEMHGVLIEVDEGTGKATSIKRVQKKA